MVLIQRVAERIVGSPGTKAYGRLAVLAQWRTKPRIVLNLPREAFTPPPKVASAVVSFEPIREPAPACRAPTHAQVTAAAFGQRRKMLRSSLKQLVPNPDALLEATGIAGTLRAEDLSVKDFARLALTFERSRRAGWPLAVGGLTANRRAAWQNRAGTRLGSTQTFTRRSVCRAKAPRRPPDLLFASGSTRP
jgi:hypothetical protein